LEDPDHRILEATTGVEALELVRSARPDLVILDWMMPGLCGIRVIEELRADRSNDGLPIIMLTAKGQDADRAQALAAGCTAYLVKPFSPLELLQIVQQVLGDAAGGDSDEFGDIGEPSSEMLQRLERADQQVALYARDLKRAFEQERARAKELTAANARLNSLGQLKTEFLAFVSHELRTPLNAMAALQLYDAAQDENERAEVIELVRSGYERLQRFIEKALDYLRWSAADATASSAPTDLLEAVERVASTTPELNSPRVHFELRAERGRCVTCARPTDLDAIVRTLVDNALKYSRDDKQVRVDLGLKHDHVVLTITDHGVGLQRGMLREIFSPFTSGDVRHHSVGSGLSLALLHAIVKTYRGRVWAASDGPGHGSTFTVELPAATAAARSAA
jgi:signal transduction histidine kinase